MCLFVLSVNSERKLKSSHFNQRYTTFLLLLGSEDLTVLKFIATQHDTFANRNDGFRVRVIVVNATCSNISDISWWSVLSVEEILSTQRKPST